MRQIEHLRLKVSLIYNFIDEHITPTPEPPTQSESHVFEYPTLHSRGSFDQSDGVTNPLFNPQIVPQPEAVRQDSQ